MRQRLSATKTKAQMIKRQPREIYSIIELAEFIGQKSAASAERFMDATEATFDQIEEMPGLVIAMSRQTNVWQACE